MNSEFLISGKIIEFFWFITTFLMFIYVLVIKFFLKQDIHPQEAIQANKYQEKPASPEDDQKQTMVGKDAHDPINQQKPLQALQLNIDTIQKSIDQKVQNKVSKLAEDTIVIKFFKCVERIYDQYLPLLSVAILCINQFASYAFATFCVLAYFLSIILFNEFQVQKGCDKACAQGMFKFVMHVWIFCLFINYFVYDESND